MEILITLKVYSKPLIRDTRSVNEDDELSTSQYVKVDDMLLVALSNITVQVGSEELIVINGSLVVLNVATTNINETMLKVNLTADEHDIGMEIETAHGRWFVNNWTYNGEWIWADSRIKVANNTSWGCINITLSNRQMPNVTGNITEVSILDFQLQPFFDEPVNRSDAHFNRFTDCIGFFSIPILAALFVGFILLLILSCGITMILDIGAVDRFEDPKGNKVFINAQE